MAAAFVFFFSFFLLPLGGLVQRGLAMAGVGKRVGWVGGGTLKARDKLSNNQRSLPKQIECLARG